jgi:hypothetical protein
MTIALRPLLTMNQKREILKFHIDEKVEPITTQTYMRGLYACNGKQKWLEMAWSLKRTCRRAEVQRDSEERN